MATVTPARVQLRHCNIFTERIIITKSSKNIVELIRRTWLWWMNSLWLIRWWTLTSKSTGCSDVRDSFGEPETSSKILATPSRFVSDFTKFFFSMNLGIDQSIVVLHLFAHDRSWNAVELEIKSRPSKITNSFIKAKSSIDSNQPPNEAPGSRDHVASRAGVHRSGKFKQRSWNYRPPSLFSPLFHWINSNSFHLFLPRDPRPELDQTNFVFD